MTRPLEGIPTYAVSVRDGAQWWADQNDSVNQNLHRMEILNEQFMHPKQGPKFSYLSLKVEDMIGSTSPLMGCL